MDINVNSGDRLLWPLLQALLEALLRLQPGRVRQDLQPFMAGLHLLGAPRKTSCFQSFSGISDAKWLRE